MPNILYSCVVDRKPLYCFQGLLFAYSLVELAGVAPDTVVVHLIDGVPAPTRQALTDLGVRTVACTPFDARHPHSNKLVQLETPILHEADYVVLCDSDVALTSGLDAWAGGSRLRAKPVDHARPPLDGWRQLFARLGLTGEFATVRATHSGESTYANNFNGGLYIVPQPLLDDLRAAWPRWNRHLLDTPGLLGDYGFHTDQISLGLALAELGHTGEPLPLDLNLPLHLPLPADYRPQTPPLVLHYHKRVDLAGRLLPSGSTVVDRAIERVNRLIVERRLLAKADAGPALRGALLRRMLAPVVGRLPLRAVRAAV